MIFDPVHIVQAATAAIGAPNADVAHGICKHRILNAQLPVFFVGIRQHSQHHRQAGQIVAVIQIAKILSGTAHRPLQPPRVRLYPFGDQATGIRRQIRRTQIKIIDHCSLLPQRLALCSADGWSHS